MNTLIAAAVTLAVIAAIAALFYFLKKRYPHSRTILINRLIGLGAIAGTALDVMNQIDLTQYFNAKYVGFAMLALTILNELFRRDTTNPVGGKE